MINVIGKFRFDTHGRLRYTLAENRPASIDAFNYAHPLSLISQLGTGSYSATHFPPAGKD
ncbi:uncharacterized protein PHALS_14381 [Plasmopara halstedii]|uniref:Uncharacterized protein n=1 Tax=Plasmopara halstedii TaxID=4781 RepID=A0A0P1ARA4_PLAHL|nr:uncharacterized protein PHALS_14381 [Plasmopara halstedii]CEG44116.1 hypothetical protein PHALS_14381 [Plasmopara halstedii]|eukprot:XP_024580485.1 hypothetical protein PHALS_14381 [Plasmopara halstedii]